jgi:hypothetical protein
MAALMPGAESGARVVEVSGKLGLEVGGIVLRERKDRVATLQRWGELASKSVYRTATPWGANHRCIGLAQVFQATGEAAGHPLR